MWYICCVAYEKDFAALSWYKIIFKDLYEHLYTLSTSTLPNSNIATYLLWAELFELHKYIWRYLFILTLLLAFRASPMEVIKTGFNYV